MADSSPVTAVGVPVALPGSRVGLVRLIWALAWPVIVTFTLESLVGLVDLLMVGRLGAAPVAGVGVGTQIFHCVAVVMAAVATGTVALVARHVGAGERSQAEAVLVQSVYAAALLSAAAAAPVFWWAQDVVRWFGVDETVLFEATGYVRWIMIGLPASATFFVIGSAMRGAGDTRTPLAIGLVVNVCNVAANYVLIFGKLGFPAMGVRGAALATTLSFAVGTVLGFAALLRASSALRLRRRRIRPRIGVAWRVLAIGIPTAIEQLLMQIGFLIYIAIAAGYGTEAVAAYFIGVRILALSFFPGFGFSAAASTLVGQQLGARRPEEAERSGWETNRLGVWFMSAGGLLIFVGAEVIARLFISDPLVIRYAVTFIRTLAVCQPLMAVDFALGGALRGAADTRFPLLTVILGFYGARLGCAYVAAYVLFLDVDWIWFALFGDYVLRAVLKAWRFHSGRWKTIAV